MKKLLTFVITMSAAILSLSAADPTDTDYSYAQCSGSYMPYPVPDHEIVLPDSLTPVFINHVGRHGARFPASPNSAVAIGRALERADSLGTITPQGRRLANIVNYVMEVSHNRWGALDSLGMAEQRGIASRMFMNFPSLFNEGRVDAISSYAPRCVMSMYEFTHQLDRLNNHNEIRTSAGRQNSALLRPFDVNEEYLAWRKSGAWKTPYDEYVKGTVTRRPLEKVLGKNYPYGDNWRELALDEYSVIAGMAAMGLDCNVSDFFDLEDYNKLWSCMNLKQYLQRTATTLSMVPAEITSQLIDDIIKTGDEAVQGRNTVTACLRFGHAETLMPLLAQLRLSGCYYMTNYFDTVALHWRDFYVVPMAANIQFLISKSTRGAYYMSVYLNEQPVTLIPGDSRLILPYSVARDYLDHVAYAL